MAREKDSPKRSTLTLVKVAFKVLKNIIREAPKSTIIILTAIVLFAIFPFAYSYITSLVIDELTQVAGQGISALGESLLILVGAYALVSVISKITETFHSFYDRKQYQTLTEYFTLQFLKKSSELDLYHYENSEKNDLIQRAKQAYNHRPQSMFNQTVWTINSFVTVITSIGIIVSFSFPLFLLLLATTLPALFINIKMSDLSYGIWDAKTETKRRFWDASSHLHNEKSLMELRIFGTKGYLFDIVKTTFFDYFRSEQKAAQKHSLWDSASGIISEIGLIILFVAFLIAVLNGQITIGLFSFYIASAGRFSNSLAGFFRRLTRVREGANYMYDYYEFMDLENVITHGSRKIAITDKTPPRLEFKHVDFAYPGTDKTILDNFELTIEPGERVAFVGENGAGKTTIIKLLSRFYNVTSGEILVDGHNIQDYNIDEWYSQIGVLFQDFVRYNFLPVKESIGVGDLKNKDNFEIIKESARKSGADEFIKDFKGKYDQVLSKQYPGGIDLSGGQWQRVALSRAFFRDAPILILDEPTSAIDPKGEAEIFDRLYEFTEGKTVIIISHRFSTVRQADKIYVIDGGKITESGSHEELMQLGGKYTEAFNTQAEGYK